MRSFIRFSFAVPVVLPLTTLACGSSKAEADPPKTPSAAKQDAPAAPAASTSPAQGEPSEAAGKIPTDCASKGEVCEMPKDFVKRLCQSTYPNVALVLFSKGTPWTHGYLTRKTQAWNAEGGASVQDWLEFDEEVVILASRMPPKGGMQVSGSGGYQAFRWDGSCVTLASEEVTLRRAPAPKHPRIEWRWLDDGIRDALRKDSDVDAAYLTQKKECKGVSVGEVTKKCEDADKKLVDAIVRFVTNTGGLPEPKKLP